MNVLTGSTSTALWHHVIQDAESACAIKLKEDLEAYLVSLLVRFTDKPEIVKQIIATELLESMEMTPAKRLVVLREVGDKCLLFSGLFPHLAEKRLVKISYFVNIGKTAYDAVSLQKDDVFNQLAKHFVGLVDILQTVRCYSKECPDLLPLQAYELWSETGSRRALAILDQYRVKR